jgi:hypothetical protein
MMSVHHQNVERLHGEAAHGRVPVDKTTPRRSDSLFTQNFSHIFSTNSGFSTWSEDFP